MDTYGQFLDQNEEALKQLPPPLVALEYYRARDMYLFDALHKDGNLKEPRRPPCKCAPAFKCCSGHMLLDFAGACCMCLRLQQCQCATCSF